ncbi:MAG: DUF86 domain-containing protein [Phaeodactylibacter sp.]|nr:DUF86 domain-containing protein [Phaeodactylibacter sp.]
MCLYYLQTSSIRNIAIHNYTKLDIAVVRSIIENHLSTFSGLTKTALEFA